MNEEAKTKAYQKHPDRVTLGDEALARVNGWLEQIRAELRGVRFSRNDLVEHVILSQPSELPAHVIAELRASRFDEVAFAAWALRELKAARARGEKLSLADIISGAHLPKERRPRRRKNAASDSVEQPSAKPESAQPHSAESTPI